MTATTHPQGTQLEKPKHGRAWRAAFAAALWIAAALLVGLANVRLASSPIEAVLAEVGVIVLMAAAYIRIAAPEATLDHALFVGTTWVLLAIAAELIMTAQSGRQWFALLGTPTNGGLRCVLLIAWLIAPALFVRSHE